MRYRPPTGRAAVKDDARPTTALQDVKTLPLRRPRLAIANDQELLDAADEQRMLNITFEEAADSYFDSTTGQMTVEWLNGDASPSSRLTSQGTGQTTRQLFNQAVNPLLAKLPEGPC